MSDTEDEECHRKIIKITVVGEPNTGKTSLCHRYLGAHGNSTPGATQGAEILAGQCLGLRPPVPIHLCDVAGNSLSTNMLKNYLYGSDIVLFVYDLSNLQSFEKLNAWFTSVKKIFENEKNPVMALFGNKSDLEHQRAVRLSCVKKLASEYLLQNYKGSARTGEMVDHAFTSLIASTLGLKVPQLSVIDSSSVNHEIKEHINGVPRTLEEIPTSPLIMNRKTLRKVHRKASSSVCCIQ